METTHAPPKPKRLTPAQAAREFVQLKPEHDERGRRLEAAKKRLLEHFAETGDAEYRGVRYSLTWFTALDQRKAKEALGPTAAEQCEVQRKRETLSLAKPSANAAPRRGRSGAGSSPLARTAAFCSTPPFRGRR